MGRTPQESVGGVLISLSRPWARRWINHWSLWRMASATPDLRLPSQLQGITAPWPVPNYTARWQRRVCVNNLPKVVTWKWNGWESNPRPFMSRANRTNEQDTTRPRFHIRYWQQYFRASPSLVTFRQKLKTFLYQTTLYWLNNNRFQWTELTA